MLDFVSDIQTPSRSWFLLCFLHDLSMMFTTFVKIHFNFLSHILRFKLILYSLVEFSFVEERNRIVVEWNKHKVLSFLTLGEINQKIFEFLGKDFCFMLGWEVNSVNFCDNAYNVRRISKFNVSSTKIPNLKGGVSNAVVLTLRLQNTLEC
jgi:hypothetical protein